jgi:hypothetical protein
MIWNPLRRKTLSDAQKDDLAAAIAGMLEIQLLTVGDKTIDSEAGGPKPKAIGYVYGFVDAVLRTKGWDMADLNIGVPVVFHILRRLWPGREQEYLSFLVEHLSDPNVLVGCQHGGQQYLDMLKAERSDKVPMGLALYIVNEV